MPTMVLLLSASTEDRIAELDDVAARELHRLSRLSYASRWQRAGRLAGTNGRRSPWAAEDARYDEVLTRGLSNGVILGGFDVALSVTSAVEMGDQTALGVLTDLVAGLADRLGDALDAERSAVAIGTDHPIMVGHAPFQLFYGMRRKPGVTHEAFSAYWLEQHSKVGVVTPGLTGYDQLHVDPEATATATAAAGLGVEVLDGVALEWFADLAAFVSAVGSKPSHGAAAKASEDNFNDIARAIGILTTVLDFGERTTP
jgi:hypothetical protein